jgi:hypothetical protein
MRTSFGGFRDSFIGGAGFTAAQLAIDGVTSSVRNMTQSIRDAGEIQTSTITSASDIATGLKISLDPALDLVKDTQMQLSKIAAALPGELEDFNAIFRQISSAIAPLSSSPLDFQKKAIEISKRAGVLSVSSGANPEQSGSVLDRFISGNSTFSELALNDIFQKNTVFTGEVRKLVTEMAGDIKNFKQLTSAQRLDILDRSLKVATPDNLIQKLKGTSETVISENLAKLFDPQSGLFGFLRAIPNMGNRTALDGFAGMLQSIFSLGEAIGSKLQFDPMENLIRLFDFISDISNRLNLVISGAVPFDLREFYKGVSDFMGSLIDRVSSFIDSVDTDKIGSAVGSMIVVLVGAIANNIPKIIEVVLKSLYKIGVGIASGFFAAIGTALVLVAKDIQTGLKAVVDPFLKPFRDFFGMIKRLFDQASNLIPRVPSIGGTAGNIVNGVNEAAKVLLPGYGMASKVGDLLLPKTQNTQPLVQPQSNTGEGQRQSSNVFAPVLNFVEGSSDPRLMASIVMQELNAKYQTFQQGSLA